MPITALLSYNQIIILVCCACDQTESWENAERTGAQQIVSYSLFIEIYEQFGFGICSTSVIHQLKNIECDRWCRREWIQKISFVSEAINSSPDTLICLHKLHINFDKRQVQFILN